MIKIRCFITLTLSLYCALTVADIERQFTRIDSQIDLVGTNIEMTTVASDTLIDIAARYGLGYNLIRSANPAVDAWMPGEGARVLLPFKAILPAAPREGIVINVVEMRLYYYPKARPGQDATVAVYPVSVGRGEWATPVKKTRITGRVKDPAWYPPETIRTEHAARGDMLPKQVPAGPNNPLGQYLLTLDIPSYFIHGSNKRFGIGMQVTHGCIRMYAEDIEQLATLVPTNTPVTIVNQVFKTGWLNQQLYLEVHRPLESKEIKVSDIRNEINDALVKATNSRPSTVIDWEKLDKIIAEATGIPELVGSLPVEQSASIPEV